MRIAGIISLDGLSIVLNQGSAAAKTTLLAGTPASDITVNLPTVATTLVGTDTSSILTYKTINATNNTISNLTLAMLASGVLNTSTSLTGATDSQVPSALAAKTYADTVAAAGVATKITGPASATDNALVRYDLTTGKLAQDSLIVVDDSGNTSGLKTLSIRNDDDLTAPVDNMIKLENRNSTSTSHPHLEFRKAGAANANLVNGDEIAGINAHPRHGGTTLTAAEQLAIYTGDGTTRLADWVWKTSNAGAPAERLRITAAGSVQISGLTASRALVTDGSKGLTSSATTATELGYISGSTGVTGTGAIVRGTSPAITTPTGIVKGDVGLGNVDNTSDATKNAATVVLTNKDFDGGTASNTSRITVPKDTYANLLTLTRKEGTLLYATDLDTFFADDGSTLTAVGSGSGSGSGQLNIVDNPSAATSASTGWTNGTSHTGSRDTSNSPLAGVVDTCFAITASAATAESWTNSTTASGFFSPSLAMPAALRNTKAQISLYVTVPAYTAAVSGGVWRLSIYNASGTRMSLSSDSSSATTLPAGFTGQFNCTFDADSSATYLVSLTQTTRVTANTLYVTNIVIGNGIITQGAAVSAPVTWTPTGSWSANTTYTGDYQRVGSVGNFHVRVSLSGAPTAATLTVNMPSGLTIDSSLVNVVVGTNTFGRAHANANGTAMNFSVVSTGSTSTVQLYFQSTASGTSSAMTGVSNTVPVSWTTPSTIDLYWSVPISEWAGSGTVNLGAGAQVEYAFNSSTATAANDTTSFAYGSSGAQIQNITVALIRRVRFQYPIQSDDLIVLEVSDDRVNWYPLDTGMNDEDGTYWLKPWEYQNSQQYGLGRLQRVSNTEVNVFFGTYAYSNGATFGAAGAAWSAGAGGAYWRVRKCKASSPVGFGLAGTDGSSGLYKAGQAPGLTTGAAIASGYVGEKFGTASTGTGGKIFQTNTTTASTTSSGVDLVTLTLNKGTYLISGFTKLTAPTGAAVNLFGSFRIGGTQVGDSYTQQTIGVSTETMVTYPTFPIDITADSTVISFRLYTGSGTATNQSNNLYAVRIA